MSVDYDPVDPNEDSDYCFIITNLSTHTDRDKLWEVFGAFGTVNQIEINTEVWAAAVIYAIKPLDQLHSQPIYIHDRLIAIKRIPLADYLSAENCLIPVNKLALGGLATPQVFIEEWMTEEFVSFDLNLNQKYLDVFFAHVDGYHRFRIEYDEKDFKNSVLLQRHGNITSLTISGKYPAYFWKCKIPMQTLTDHYHLTSQWWERVTEIPLGEVSRDIMKQKEKAMSKEPIVPNGYFPDHTIRLNNWTVYRLEFDIPLKPAPKYALVKTLTPNNLSHEVLENAIKQATGLSSMPSTPQIQVQGATKRINVETITANMSFDVQYMMEHAFNLKILREYNVEADFFKKMQQLPPQVACSFLTLLSAPQQRVYNPDTVINSIYTPINQHISYQQPIPDECMMVRKLLVTPTSIYPLQPTVEPMNHLQFQFRGYADRFLLVQFTDEDLQPMASILPTDDDESTESQNIKVYDRIYNVLRKGIRIARRTYEFLGASTDDMRAHQCWFFVKNDIISRADILTWMGDFREITKVADFVSCVGQNFAPRLMELEIKANEIEELTEDYGYNGYKFTTDCGKMSPAIAREIAKELGLEYTPSVVKFNLAGAKGILMLSNYLTKRKIQLRSSQIRCDSPRLTLEVIQVSKPNKVFLNRKSIAILSSLGIRNYVFQDFLNEAIVQYKKFTLHKDEVPYDLMNDYYTESGRMDDFQTIIDSGFLNANDPFINNLASSYQNKALNAIQKDAQLYVQQGARVFAIMDETGTLGKNECFIQITDPSGLSSRRQTIEGPCLIYRESSCFPGDVQAVEARNEPKLKHYTNVLVYSAFDARDIPSACSNDDYDIDNFTVIWDMKLIPSRMNLAPRNYVTQVTPSTLPKIAFKEMAKFFTTFISKDRLDQLKKAYIAISDRHKEGILHGDCIYLSQQLSRALDFAKTGVYATIYREFHHYPFPDFMEENELRTYTSKKPNGQIYRISSQLVAKQYLTNHCAYNPKMYVDKMYEYIADARKTMAKYDHSLRILLGQYSVQTEVEFISGHIIHWPKYLPIKDREGYVERLRMAYVRFKSYWRQMFELEFVDYKGEDLNEQISAKAAAWYYVTYHRSEYKSDVTYNKTMARYMSFPWVVDDYMAFIAMKNAERPKEDRFLQPVPADLINNMTKRHHDSFVLCDDSDEEEEEDEEEGEVEEEKVVESSIEQGAMNVPEPRAAARDERPWDEQKVPTIVQQQQQHTPINGTYSNSQQQVYSSQQQQQQSDYSLPAEYDDDTDEVPVLSVKLSDLLK